MREIRTCSICGEETDENDLCIDHDYEEDDMTRPAYYARPISIDGTKQADRDMELIAAMGFTPYPVGEEKATALARYREIGMEAFRPYVEASAALFFRSFPDGSIGAGVRTEIDWALAAGIPVVEIPRQVVRRTLSVDDTRAMLTELGQR